MRSRCLSRRAFLKGTATLAAADLVGLRAFVNEAR